MLFLLDSHLKKAESLLGFQFRFWIPAFAGMTAKENGVYHGGLITARNVF